MATKGEAEGIARRHRGRLVRVLERDGLLADRRWRTAFADVPRHMFLPRFFRPVSPTEWAAIDSSDDDWLTQVYANRVLVTQLDGDPARWELARAGGRISGVPTSSSSMPAIMAVMLEALDVVDGNQVLEIGTGTGYNAALLCHRLGADHLTTVDIDAELVDAARQRLAAIGYRPTCAATDGAAGYPPRASYDRVVCTCAVSTVPLPWLAQTRPGGIVVTTLNRPLGAGLVRITVDADGTGQGRVLADDGRFMPLRAHRRHLDEQLVARLGDAQGATRDTEVAASVVASPNSPFEFFAGLHLPGTLPASIGSDTVLLVHQDGSWARHRTEDGRHQVTEGGPRRLWDTVEKAYVQWSELGRPRRSRFGITVGPSGQELWLDTPDSPYRWSLGQTS